MTSFLIESQRLTLRYLMVGTIFAATGFVYSYSAYQGETPAWLRPLLIVAGLVVTWFAWEQIRPGQDVAKELVASTPVTVSFDEVFNDTGYSSIRSFVVEIAKPDVRADALAAIEFLVSRLKDPEHVLALGPGFFTLSYGRVLVYFAIGETRHSQAVSVSLVGGSVSEPSSAKPFGVVQLVPTFRDVTAALAPELS